jgi:hypothetical protein
VRYHTEGGKDVYQTLIVAGKSEKAVARGQTMLKKMALVMGLSPSSLNPSQMIGQPVCLVLSVRDDGEYGPQNRVKDVLPYDQSLSEAIEEKEELARQAAALEPVAPQPEPEPESAAAAAQAPTGTAPWRPKKPEAA